jgi:hypothetical protein
MRRKQEEAHFQSLQTLMPRSLICSHGIAAHHEGKPLAIIIPSLLNQTEL